MRTTAFCDCQ